MVTPALASKVRASRVQEINSKKLDLLRQHINDENYLHSAIQRLALVLSNELMNINREGIRNEKQRKRRY